MSASAPFNPKGKQFDEFVKAMADTGYISVDPHALMSAHLTLQAMVDSDENTGPIQTIILDGPPGTGKSFIAECMANAMGAEYIEYNCHPDASFEDLVKDIDIGAPVAAQSGFMTDKPTREDLYILGPLLQAVMISKDKKVVLLIDELDKARSAVDALLLTLLNSGRIFVQGMGEKGELKQFQVNRQNILIVIAKNDERDLHNALLRRGHVIYIDYPHKDIEASIIRKEAGVGPEAARSLVTQANKLRKDANVGKPPSLPELVRLAQDFRRIAQSATTGTTPTATDPLVCHVPKNVLNQAAVNGLLAKQEDQPLGRKLLGDKSYGTLLLSAVLRGMGYKDRKVRYYREQEILDSSKRS